MFFYVMFTILAYMLFVEVFYRIRGQNEGDTSVKKGGKSSVHTDSLQCSSTPVKMTPSRNKIVPISPDSQFGNEGEISGEFGIGRRRRIGGGLASEETVPTSSSSPNHQHDMFANSYTKDKINLLCHLLQNSSNLETSMMTKATTTTNMSSFSKSTPHSFLKKQQIGTQHCVPYPSAVPYHIPEIQQKCTLLIAYMPWEATEDDIFDKFSQFVNVKRVRIVVDRVSRRPRCFGFVKFCTHEDAKHALVCAKAGKITLPDMRGHVWHMKAEWASTEMVIDDAAKERVIDQKRMYTAHHSQTATHRNIY